MKKPLFLLLLFLSISLINCVGFSQPGDTNFPYLQDLQALRKDLQGELQIRGEDTYNPKTYNIRTNVPKPAAIAIIESEQDAIKAFKFAKKHNLRVSVQSTGHHQDIRNIADNSLLIDMQKMKKLEVDVPNKKVTLQTGNVYGEIHEKVSIESQHSLVVMSGADASVGPYGFTVGGGHGRLNRQFGLGVDALLSVRILLADGNIVTASEEENQDLFWALRGSGGQAYGITLEMTFQLFDAPGKVQEFTAKFDSNDETATVFSNWMKSIPNTSGAYYSPLNQPSASVIIAAFCFGDDEKCAQDFKPLIDLCNKQANPDNSCHVDKKFDTYWDYVSQLHVDKGPAQTYLISTALDGENLELGLQNVNRFFREHDFADYGILRCAGNSLLGGKAAELDPMGEKTSVARAMRTSLMVLTCYAITIEGLSTTKATMESQINLMDGFSKDVFEVYGTDKWVYWNEPNHNFKDDSDWQSRYWGGLEKYNKLLEVKEKYDKENFFTCYHCVGWNEKKEVEPALCPEEDCSCSNTDEGVCAITTPILKKEDTNPDDSDASLLYITSLLYFLLLALI